MRVRGSCRRNLDDRHHAAIFVRENVAMQYVKPRVVNEATAHLEITGNSNRFALTILERNLLSVHKVRWRVTGWNRKHIPPDQMRLRLWRTTRFPRARIVRIQITLARRERCRVESGFNRHLVGLRIDRWLLCLWIAWRPSGFPNDSPLVRTKHFDQLTCI